MKIAIKVGGSVFCPNETPDVNFVKKLSNKIQELSKQHTILVIVGGGKLARKMIEDKKKTCSDKNQLDMEGINASRSNANVLINEMGKDVFSGIPKNENEAFGAIKNSKIVVLGGFRPGQTTDAVTLQTAKIVGCDLVIIGTDVKGVYDKDPKSNKEAVLLSDIDSAKLLEMTKSEGMEPGKRIIVDPIAAEIIHKDGIKTYVLDIRDMDNLENAINGDNFLGTIID